VVLEDDSSLKPYKVRALTAQTLREGYPSQWTDEWWYIAEALVRWRPARSQRGGLGRCAAPHMPC